MVGICAPCAQTPKNTMNSLKYRLALLSAVGSIVFAASTNAGPPTNWPPNFPSVVRSQEEAVKYPEGKVALACKDCKTVSEKSGADKKGILSWFSSENTHGCSGCGGKVTIKPIAGGKVPGIPEYTHTCSKCGDNSAYTCSSHKMK